MAKRGKDRGAKNVGDKSRIPGASEEGFQVPSEFQISLRLSNEGKSTNEIAASLESLRNYGTVQKKCSRPFLSRKRGLCYSKETIPNSRSNTNPAKLTRFSRVGKKSEGRGDPRVGIQLFQA